MIYIGFLMAIVSVWGLWLVRKGRLDQKPHYLKLMTWAVLLPSFANIAGWIMTEVGRQPWIVFGLQKTVHGVSPTVPLYEVAISFVGFTLLYLIIGIVEVRLLLKFIRLGPEEKEAYLNPAEDGILQPD